MRQRFGIGELLEPLRPWTDEAEVARVLARWGEGRKGCEKLADGHYREVAYHLRLIGRSRTPVTPEHVDGIAFFMIHNLVSDREVTDYGDGFQHIKGAPSERTRRRYRKYFGSQAGWQWMRDSLQYDMDVAGLVNGGRSPAAARQWLLRNPGKHAKDAPPPRRTPEPTPKPVYVGGSQRTVGDTD